MFQETSVNISGLSASTKGVSDHGYQSYCKQLNQRCKDNGVEGIPNVQWKAQKSPPRCEIEDTGERKDFGWVTTTMYQCSPCWSPECRCQEFHKRCGNRKYQLAKWKNVKGEMKCLINRNYVFDAK